MIEWLMAIIIATSKANTDKMNELYYKSAYERAVCIADGPCTWSHDGWTEHVKEHVGGYQWAGENLARDFNTWEQVIAAWEKSPEHKKVLERKHCYQGLARYKNVFVLHKGC